MCLTIITRKVAALYRLYPIVLEVGEMIILPVFWYGLQTSSFTLEGKRGLRTSENRVMKRIFGSKRGTERERDGVIGD
jgi:hypothetical protein